MTRKAIEAKSFDLKAVNHNKVTTEDSRTPDELLDIIEAKGQEVSAVLEKLRS